MKTATIVFDRTQTAPLYCYYRGQMQAQPAYATLNLKTGAVSADYSGDVGNGMPAEVWHGRVRRYPINNHLTGAQTGELLDSLLPVFQRILSGSEIVWDGNNNVGVLNEDAAAAEAELIERGELGADYEAALITDLREWLSAGNKSDWMPETGDAAEFLDQLEAHIKREFTVIQNIQDVVADMWADELYDGNDLPQCVAEYLIADGRCEDSQWTEELAAYSAGRKPE